MPKDLTITHFEQLWNKRSNDFTQDEWKQVYSQPSLFTTYSYSIPPNKVIEMDLTSLSLEKAKEFMDELVSNSLYSLLTISY